MPRRRMILAALAALLLLLTAAPARAADPVQAGAGDQPSAVTDREGATYLVWDENHGDGTFAPYGKQNPDTVGFCVIPRGSATCDPATVKHLLTPGCHKQDFPYAGSSDHESDRPHVEITPFGEVFVVTHGYCYDNPDPYALPTDYTYVFTSTDDGQTFDDGQKIGQARPAAGYDYNTASVLDPADRRVVTVLARAGNGNPSDTDNSGLWVQGAALGSQSDAWLKLSSDPTTLPYVIQTGKGAFVMAWRSVNGLFLRSYDCPDCTLAQFSDSSRWSAPMQIDADGDPDEASLVSGPSGTFLIYADDHPPHQFYSRRLTQAPATSPATTPVLTAGDRYPVTQAVAGGLGAAIEDPSTGRIHFMERDSYEDSTGSTVDSWDYRTSDDGQTWSAPTHLPPADYRGYVNPPVLTAATGDDGFTGLYFYWATSEGNAPFYANTLPGSGSGPTTPPGGTPPGGTPPGQTPPGGTPPGGTTPTTPQPSGTSDACKVFQFGPLDIKADACLTREGTTFVAKGAVHVNGLTIAGTEVRFDPVARTVKSVGPVDLSAGAVKFFHGSIDWSLPKGNSFDLGSFDFASFGAKLEGFPLKGSADVKLVRGAVEIPLTVGMPKLLGGVTASVTLRADNLAGVHVRELKLAIGDAPLGPLELKNVEFSYDPDDEAWTGGGTIILPPQPPGPSLDAHVGFSHGDLDFLKGELTFPGEGIPLEPTDVVHLTKIRFALAKKPDLKLSGGITISAGPKFGEAHVASIDGDLSFTFPEGKPAIFRADGQVELFDQVDVAEAFIQYETDGHVSFGGNVHYDIGPVSFKAAVDGWFYKSAFNIEGDAHICAGDFACAGGTALISSNGFAVCADLDIADVGVGAHWSPVLFTPLFFAGLHVMATGCDVGPYRAVAASAAVRGHAAVASSFRLGSGLPSAFVGVRGKDGPPHVVLVGPHGQRIVAPASGPLSTKRARVLHVVQDKMTWFVLGKPSAGTWHVATLGGSTPVTGVKVANGLPKPKVTAKVTGKGRARVLAYRVAPLPGQRVSFAEVGKGAAKPIGSARGAKGKLRFRPADGPGGIRRVIALVTSYGTPRATLTVARYRAPGPERPAKPAGLKLTRTGSHLTITWHAARLADRYQVHVKLSDSRSLIFFVRHGKTRRVSVPRITKKTTGTVTIQSIRATGFVSKPAAARLSVPKKKKPKKHPKPKKALTSAVPARRASSAAPLI